MRSASESTEDVPWARPGAPHTDAFCAVVAWLAQRVDKTTITKLRRVWWEAVAKIVIAVVGDVLNDDRFEGLVRLGVDEVSYRKGRLDYPRVRNVLDQSYWKVGTFGMVLSFVPLVSSMPSRKTKKCLSLQRWRWAS